MNYSEEEKETIKRIDYIQDFIIENGQYNADVEEIKTFSVLLNLIQKQEKIIDKMAEQLAGLTIWNDNIQEPLILGDKEEVIEYFKKEVEKNEQYKEIYEEVRQACYQLNQLKGEQSNE